MYIHVRNITRRYRKTVALQAFDWDIRIDHDTIHGLIGPNGAGKTTILKILSGIYTYEAGDITVDGIEPPYDVWARDHVAFLAAGDRGIRYRNSVADNVRYFGALKAVDPEITQTLLDRYGTLLKMDALLDRDVGTLSTGEKKKAMLLMALASGSRIIIMDEPSDGLDISAKVDLQHIIKMIADQTETCFIISTHDIDFISDLANHYTFISKGSIAYEHDGAMALEAIRTKFLAINRVFDDDETP